MSNLVYKKNSNCPWQTFESETLIIDPINQFSFELSDTGSLIWQSIDGKRTLAEISQVIEDHFDVSIAEAQKDVTDFIELLVSHQLVENMTL